MTQDSLEGEDVLMVLIKMSREGMPEGMSCKAMRPAELLLRNADVMSDKIGSNRFVWIMTGPEQIVHGLAINAPVMSESIQGELRQRDIAVRAVLGSCDMDLHVQATDIFIAKMDSLADAKTAAVHQDDDEPDSQIIDRIDELSDLFARRDIRDILVELPEWKLIGIPWLMQDIEREETELRDDGVDRTIRKIAFPLDPIDEITLLLPGNLIRTAIQVL